MDAVKSAGRFEVVTVSPNEGSNDSGQAWSSR